MTLAEKVYTHLDMQVLVDAIGKTLEEKDNVTADAESAEQKGHSPVSITEKCPIFFRYLYCHRFPPHLTTSQTLVK